MRTAVPRNRRREHARSRLAELISARSATGARLLSERELARECGVCRTTVRRVLAELEGQGAVDRRHGAGTFVVSARARQQGRRTRRIAVIGWERYGQRTGWDLRGEVVKAIGVYGQRLGAAPEEFGLDRPDDAARIRDRSAMRDFDGFVAVGVDDPELLGALLDAGRGPVVLVDGYVRGLPVATVVDGGREGMRAVTRHLLGLGHRRIAFLDCHNRALNNPEKFAGYCAALAERGVPLDEALVAVPPACDDRYVLGAGRFDGVMQEFLPAAIDALLRLADPPTALIGFDDFRALGAAAELERRGLRVGADFSVAGFGDGAFRRGLHDSLTSSRIYPRAMGREALRAALAPASSSEARTVFVPTRLVVRQTTCRPPTADRPRADT